MNTLVIDGGASAAKWGLYSAGHVLVASGNAGPLDGHVYDAARQDDARATLADIRRALPDAGTIGQVISGIAGLDGGSSTSRWYRTAIAETFGVTLDRTLAADDLGMVYLGNFAPGRGIVVYAGTGSIAVHVDKALRLVRAGGYGYLIEDAGGGFWIGKQALRAFLIALEQGPIDASATLFTQLLVVFGSSDWGGIKAKTYRGGRRFIASLSRQVVAGATAGDHVAIDILDRAAGELSGLAGRLLNQLEQPQSQVKFIGGIAGVSPGLDAALAAGLGPDMSLIPGGVASSAAIYLAYRNYGLAGLGQIIAASPDAPSA